MFFQLELNVSLVEHIFSYSYSDHWATWHKWFKLRFSVAIKICLACGFLADFKFAAAIKIYLCCDMLFASNSFWIMATKQTVPRFDNNY